MQTHNVPKRCQAVYSVLSRGGWWTKAQLVHAGCTYDQADAKLRLLSRLNPGMIESRGVPGKRIKEYRMTREQQMELPLRKSTVPAEARL